MSMAKENIMGFFNRLFEKKQAAAATSPARPAQSSPSTAAGHESSGVLDSLERCKGTDELYEMLRTRSAAEVEDACRRFPIESIRLNWGSAGADARTGDTEAILSEILSEQGMRDIKRFELITVLAQTCVRYEEILTQSPELRLPRSLPARQLAEILMSRLMPFIRAQQGVEVTHTLRIRLYDFAMALMLAGGHDRDALDCLLVSRPSLREDHDFWIAACRYNVAQVTKTREDVLAAIETAEAITSGRVKVPGKYIQGATGMLEKLRQMAV
jgi:hypothetical protein